MEADQGHSVPHGHQIGDFLATNPARLVNESQHDLSWIAALCQKAEEASSSGCSKRMVQEMLEEAHSLVGGDRVVFVPWEGRRHSRITFEFRRSPAIPSLLGLSVSYAPLPERAHQAGKPAVFDSLEVLAEKSSEVFRQGKIRRAILASVTYGGKLIGTLGIHDVDLERTVSEADLLKVRLLCTLFGLSLGWLYHKEAVHKSTVAFMEDLGRTLSEEQSLFRPQVCPVSDRRDDERLILNFPQLTKRERQILVRLEQSNKEIARELCLSELTVRNHVARVLDKLGVASRRTAYHLLLSSLEDDRPLTP